MITFFSKYKPFAIVMVVLSAIIIFVIYSLLKPKETLPVWQPSMVNPELVDSTVQHVRKYHQVAPFKLVNQNGDTITEQKFADKIYVADFFFTTCLTICPVMTDHMAEIQEEIMDDPDVLLLSHTVTPEIDSVSVLKKYARRKGVKDEKWDLVTGDKKELYALARKSYLATKTSGSGDAYDMIHTENFVLVDQKQRVRAFYDGTDPEAVAQVLHDIEILKAEAKREADR
ncbi:SCO family protein [Gangjinia marincola]|uniref:SCO family protein n=1 Tax=Gangjinia marincola TaxID=578463 RepID=A0ABP3XWV9_9FLAO